TTAPSVRQTAPSTKADAVAAGGSDRVDVGSEREPFRARSRSSARCSLARDALELLDQRGIERALAEALAHLLERRVPRLLLVGAERDELRLALDAIEG